MTQNAKLHHICIWENKITIRKLTCTLGTQDSLSLFHIDLSNIYWATLYGSVIVQWDAEVDINTTQSRSGEVQSQVSETYQYIDI